MLERVTNLFRNLVIYGLGDVATQLASLLLLPIFTRYLTPDDYGVIALLVLIEGIAKVVFRWGVDTAFMRLYFDCPDQPGRQRLASTIAIFLMVVNGTLVAVGVALSGWLSRWLIGTDAYRWLVALTIANIFLAGFYFIPYQVLRIGERSRQYISLTFLRSVTTIVLRLLLVITFRQSVAGWVYADCITTVCFTLVMLPWFAPLIRPTFSVPILKEALGFGLPRVPHSVAQQILGGADRWFLKRYRGLDDVGVYSLGATFGLTLKTFLAAFEVAWTPFFLGLMREPDAPQIYREISTYVAAVIVLLVAGLCALAPGLVRVFTAPQFHGAAAVTPIIAIGAMFQGFYLLGSIGLVITKRTSRYPIATGIAAAVSIVANLILIPPFGMIGAAWANVIAYATLTIVTSAFSYREYPIRYEWPRLARIGAAGLAGYASAAWLVSDAIRPLPNMLLRGVVVVVVYGAALYATGFFHARELARLRDIQRRLIRDSRAPRR